MLVAVRAWDPRLEYVTARSSATTSRYVRASYMIPSVPRITTFVIVYGANLRKHCLLGPVSCGLVPYFTFRILDQSTKRQAQSISFNMPLMKPSPSPSSRASSQSNSRSHHGSTSSSGFHPFGGRVSKHFSDNVSRTKPYCLTMI